MQIPYRKPGKYSQIKPDPFLTKKKLRALEKKLEALKTHTRLEAAQEVARLAELGDFSENAEYQLAKARLRGINNTILKLEYQITNAEVIPDTSPDGKIHIGSTVTIESAEGTRTYEILGSSETNPSKGVISHLSPLGASLIGKQSGDTVTIELGGKKRSFTIREIR